MDVRSICHLVDEATFYAARWTTAAHTTEDSLRSDLEAIGALLKQLRSALPAPSFDGHSLPLFDLPPRARARRTDIDTSHAAARSLDPDRIRRSQRSILSVIDVHGPMTDTELVAWYQVHTHGQRQSVSGIRTRRSELVRAGLVRDTGERVMTGSGRRAARWEITRLGREFLLDKTKRAGSCEPARVRQDGAR